MRSSTRCSRRSATRRKPPRRCCVPSYLHPKIAEWKKIERDLEEKLGREPALAEIAEAAGAPERLFPIMASALLTLKSIHQTVSIDSTGGDEDASSLAGELPDLGGSDPADVAEEHHNQNRLTEILGDMPKRSLEILRLRYGLGGAEPCTLREVGEKVHLSRERVRQIENESLAELRRLFDSRAEIYQG